MAEKALVLFLLAGAVTAVQAEWGPEVPEAEQSAIDQDIREAPIPESEASVQPRSVDKPEPVAEPGVQAMPEGWGGRKSAHWLEWEAHAEEAPVAVEKDPRTAAVKRSVLVPRAAPKAIAGGKRVLGWHPYWATTNDTYNYQYSNLTTIAYFSYEVNSTNGGYDSIHSWNTDPVVEWAHSNGVKVVLTATLFGDTANQRLLTNAVACSNLISNLLTVVGNRGGDGVCIDFEDVGSWTGATTNLTAFMSNLTTRFHAADPDYEVSIALPSVDWSADFAVSNYDRFGLDYAIIMGYDYYYSGSGTPGPVAPLYSSAQWIGASSWCSVDYSMDYYLGKGISPEKLMLGVPYYGRRWAAASTNLGAASLGSAYSAALTYGACKSAAATYGKLWDTNGSVPYYVYTSSSTNYQCFFDDTNSLALKYDLSEANGMGGIGIWNLTQGTGQAELWSLIGEKFGAAAGAADWQSQDPGTTTAFYGAGAKASGLAVVGTGGAISTSADGGVTWTSRTSGTSSLLLNITSGGSLWVAVGDAGAVVTSPGGATWTVQSTPTNAMLRGIAYGNSAYVACGANGTILRSTDGTNWVIQASGTMTNLQGVCFGNGQFIAVGESGVLLASANGSSWTSRTSNAGHWLLGAAYGNGTYVAVGLAARIVTSPDGITWTRQTNSLPNSTANLYRVAYGNGQFAAVGQDGAIWGSTNGVDWTAENSGTTNFLRGLVFSNDLFVAAGYTGTILTKGAGDPAVVITTAGATVPNGTASQTIAGTANAYAVGTLGWSNSLGGGGSFAAATNWSFSASLSVGTNVITVTATNSLGTAASDTVTFIREAAAGGGESGIAETAAAQPVGALSGIVVYAGAGHGFGANDALTAWVTERVLTNALNEDSANVDQLNYFAELAWKAGATVVPFRPVGYQTNEVVLDNVDTNSGPSGQVTYGGTWADTTQTTLYYGAVGEVGYRYANANTTGTTAWAIYRPDLPAAGYYPVYTWVRYGSDRANQLYRVYHSGGVTDVRVDHNQVGLGWVWLGNYHFAAGTTGSVNISNYDPAGAGEVVIADAIRFGNGMGDTSRGAAGLSGFESELESSRFWTIKSMGVGFSTALYDLAGYNDYDDNIGQPARMAANMCRTNGWERWRRLYVGYHSNANANPTVRGVWALGDSRLATNAAYAAYYGGQTNLGMSMAKRVHTNLSVGVTAGVIPSWSSSFRSYTYDFTYGEIYNSYNSTNVYRLMDTTILEVAFHSSPDDATVMKTPAGREWIARATVQGIVDHLSQYYADSTVPAAYAPDAPVTVKAANSASGAVTVTWTMAATNRASGDAPTGFVIYSSEDGKGFGNPVAVSGGATRSQVLSGLTAGATLFFRVCATNSGGESANSPLAGVRVSANGARADVLVVDGFKRNDATLAPTRYVANGLVYGNMALVRPRMINSRDYVKEHGLALAGAGRTFDSLDAADVTAAILTNYSKVVWMLGEESTADETFSSAEQAAVSNYLAAGGRLMVSGAEIGWDLGRAGVSSAGDVAFFTNTLRTLYSSDSGATSNITATATGILSGISLRFNYTNLLSDIYAANYPDVLAAGSGAAVAAVYGTSAGGASGAAIQYSNATYRTFVMGFPFETILEESNRISVMTEVMDFFDAGAPESPAVDITTASQTVAAGTTSLLISGTNNAAVVGTMRWTNSLGGTGTFPAALSWSTNLALAIGTNVFTVSGTNSAGTSASDTVQIVRPADPPVVVITTADQTVAAGTDSLLISGTNNAAVVGTMRWTNALAGTGGTFAAAASWSATVALSVGTNQIQVSGTNSAGTVASDAVQIIRPAAASGPVTIFEDDFEDGDLAGWTQDATGNWTNSTATPIAGARSLKHNLVSVAATNQVYAQPVYDLAADTTTWRFKLANGNWDPSADNRFHVYLAASDNDFKGTAVNGYAVGINLSGTSDLVSLWRVTAGAAGATVLASALDWNAAATNAIEVTRTAAGEWELKTSTNGTYSGMVSAGTAVDTTYMGTTYFGLYYKCTSTRAGQVWLDDVLIHQGELSGVTDTDGDGMSDDYENTYFGGATNGLAGADDDDDGVSNFSEYIAGTHPLTNASVLAVASMTPQTGAVTNLVFRWPSVTGRVYSIRCATNAGGVYTQNVGGIAANAPTNTYTNAAPAAAGTYFYGIGVQLAP